MTTLIETIRIRNGTAPLWHLHLRRLVTSCQALGVPFPGSFEVPAAGADRVHRIEVGSRGMTVTQRDVGGDSPVRLATSRVPHPGYRHKTTDRAAFAAAGEEARRAGAEDALLLADGLVAECPIWCVYWWEGDRLAAPPLDLGILQGVSRVRIEELAGPVGQMRVTVGELAGRALLLSNAVRGIVEVASLDGVPAPRHAGTAALRARFWP